MNYEAILVDVEDGVGAITLNRPDKLNAMNRQLMSEVKDALKKFEADDEVGCVVFTGAGRAFSAGGDIHEQREHDRRYSRGRARQDAHLRAAARHRRLPETDDRHDERARAMAARRCWPHRSTCGSAARTRNSVSSPPHTAASTRPGPAEPGRLADGQGIAVLGAHRRGRGSLSHRPAEPSRATRAAARQDDGIGENHRRPTTAARCSASRRC